MREGGMGEKSKQGIKGGDRWEGQWRNDPKLFHNWHNGGIINFIDYLLLTLLCLEHCSYK